jgi:hypothetical protein
MAEHVAAQRATEEIPADSAQGVALTVAPGLAGSVLALQRTAGNAAVAAWAARPPARVIARCGAGGCTCGGRCGGHGVSTEEQAEDLRAALALRRAVTRRTLARQVGGGGGPYHPPVGTPMGCTEADSCSAISTKINYLRHTIRSHQEWDAANPDPRWPGGRHAGEIADLQRALANCTAIATRKCTRQPVWVPAEQPAENPNERTERVKRQLYEALPYAVAVVVVGLVIACVIAEPCGAAVAAALAAVLGEEALAAVIAILASNGVRLAW